MNSVFSPINGSICFNFEPANRFQDFSIRLIFEKFLSQGDDSALSPELDASVVGQPPLIVLAGKIDVDGNVFVDARGASYES